MSHEMLVKLACLASLLAVAGCQRSEEALAREAVAEALGHPARLEIRNVRAVASLAPGQAVGPALSAPLGAGLCGDLRAKDRDERYFIWERRNGAVHLASESGVATLPNGGAVMWTDYCRDR